MTSASDRTLTDLELAGALSGIAAFHVIDHQAVPERWHTYSHAAAGLAAVALGRLAGLSSDDLGVAPRSFASGLKLGALHGAISLAIVGVGPLLPALAPLLDDGRLHESRTGASLSRSTLVDIPLGTAFYEELVFRGALHGLLTRRLGSVGGMVAGSVLFGLWHVLPALEDRKHNPATAQRHPVSTVVPTVVGTALAGAWFTFLRERSGSVLAPMLVHAATNSGALASATFVARHRRRLTRQTVADGSEPLP